MFARKSPYIADKADVHGDATVGTAPRSGTWRTSARGAVSARTACARSGRACIGPGVRARRPLQGAEPRTDLRAGGGRGRRLHRPAVVFTNDYLPRAVTPDGRLKTADDWTPSGSTVRTGRRSAPAPSASHRSRSAGGPWWPPARRDQGRARLRAGRGGAGPPDPLRWGAPGRAPAGGAVAGPVPAAGDRGGLRRDRRGARRDACAGCLSPRHWGDGCATDVATRAAGRRACAAAGRGCGRRDRRAPGR